MSGFQKNVASQKWLVFAFADGGHASLDPGEPVASDASNITAKIRKDYGSATGIGDANPTEIEDGYYEFDLTQAETNADVLDMLPESSTAGVQVIGVPGRVFTVAENFNALGIASDGDLTKVNALDGHTAQTGDNYARLGAAGAGLTAVPWNSAWDAEVQSEANDALVALGLDHLVSAAVAGADVADNSILAKLVSSSATADWDDFVNTTESLQALRDRGDAAWITATGFSTHTAANVRTEIDSNSTQLAAIVADTNEVQGDWANGGRLDLILDELTTQGNTNETKIDTIDGIVDAILVDTGTTIPAQITALNDLSAADVNAQVDTALSDIHLDHLLAADNNPASKPGTSTALLNELIENDSGVSRFTVNALEQAPSGGGGGGATNITTQTTSIQSE